MEMNRGITWKCAVCDNVHGSVETHVTLVKCPVCGNPVKAVRAYPTPVTRTTKDRNLVLGQELLQDCQRK